MILPKGRAYTVGLQPAMVVFDGMLMAAAAQISTLLSTTAKQQVPPSSYAS